MQRALGRAYSRLKGTHPRRPPSLAGRGLEVLCDAMLALAAIALLGGLALVAWGLVAGVALAPIVAGVALAGVSPLVLLLWERVAWEPFGERLSHLS